MSMEGNEKFTQEKDYLITPAVTNAMEARIVEKVGFHFVYTGDMELPSPFSVFQMLG